jgi:hypothetical protein
VVLFKSLSVTNIKILIHVLIGFGRIIIIHSVLIVLSELAFLRSHYIFIKTLLELLRLIQQMLIMG